MTTTITTRPPIQHARRRTVLSAAVVAVLGVGAGVACRTCDLIRQLDQPSHAPAAATGTTPTSTPSGTSSPRCR